MKHTWKDITSYSRSETDRVPRTYQLETFKISKVAITRHISYAKDDWILSCEFMPMRVISQGTAEEAQEAAIKALQRYFTTALAQLK